MASMLLWLLQVVLLAHRWSNCWEGKHSNHQHWSSLWCLNLLFDVSLDYYFNLVSDYFTGHKDEHFDSVAKKMHTEFKCKTP